MATEEDNTCSQVDNDLIVPHSSERYQESMESSKNGSNSLQDDPAEEFDEDDFKSFFQTYGEDFSVDISMLEEPISEKTSPDTFVSNNYEEEERQKSLDQYGFGRLPDFNEKSIPQGKLWGYRGEKVSLKDFFAECIIGKLPPLTKIGAVQHLESETNI